MAKPPKKRIVMVFIIFVVLVFISIILIKNLSYQAQTSSPFELCDLDRNYVCDSADEVIFENSYGSCRGEEGYSFGADINGDGCVSSPDKENFYRIMGEGPAPNASDGVPDGPGW